MKRSKALLMTALASGLAGEEFTKEDKFFSEIDASLIYDNPISPSNIINSGAPLKHSSYSQHKRDKTKRKNVKRQKNTI